MKKQIGLILLAAMTLFGQADRGSIEVCVRCQCVQDRRENPNSTGHGAVSEEHRSDVSTGARLGNVIFCEAVTRTV